MNETHGMLFSAFRILLLFWTSIRPTHVTPTTARDTIRRYLQFIPPFYTQNCSVFTVATPIPKFKYLSRTSPSTHPYINQSRTRTPVQYAWNVVQGVRYNKYRGKCNALSVLFIIFSRNVVPAGYVIIDYFSIQGGNFIAHHCLRSWKNRRQTVS